MFTSAAGLGAPKLETRKALLLVDLQKDFVDREGKLFISNTAEFLPKLPSLISKFRTKGDVFFIKTEFDGPRSIYSAATGGYGLVLKSNVASQRTSIHPADGDEEQAPTPPAEASHVVAGGRLNSDVEAFLTPPYNSQASWSQCCQPNSSGASWPDVLSSAIDPSVDTTIVKSHYSPFQDDSFLLHLRIQLITELYICGSLSNISVYSTVIDAVSHGMSVTIIEDCVGYRDEHCHHEAMRQMADMMGALGTDYQELMDDLAGLLGDVVREEEYTTQHQVAFQRGLQNKHKPDLRQKTSAWLSSLEMTPSDALEASPNINQAPMQSNTPATEASRATRQDTELLSGIFRPRPNTPDSPPRKRQSEDLEPDVRDPKTVHTRRRASHEGHIGEEQRTNPNRTRRRRLRDKEPRRSPTPQLEVRPNIESKSTGDIPLAPASVPTQQSFIFNPDDPEGRRRNTSSLQDTVSSRSRQERQSTRSTKARKEIPPKPLGPDESIAADSSIVYDILPEDLASMIFVNLHSEVLWQKMHHRSGEVPRLVAIQGESSPNKVPIYRHPADSQPSLVSFTPNVQKIRRVAEDLVGHPLNHVLIQLYRTPEDNISEHSDKTLDIQRGSKIVNYSAGALRTMILRSKRSVMSTLELDLEAAGTFSTGPSPGPPRPSLRVPMPHNSLFILGPETNQSHQHAIRADKRPSSLRSEEERAYDGARISLTFRHIATFIDPRTKKIWGQGAKGKTEDQAAGIVEGSEAEKEYESMIRAFGQENHRSSTWDWSEWYGKGFDVVDAPITASQSATPVAEKLDEQRTTMRSAELSIGPGIDPRLWMLAAKIDTPRQTGEEI